MDCGKFRDASRVCGRLKTNDVFIFIETVLFKYHFIQGLLVILFEY